MFMCELSLSCFPAFVRLHFLLQKFKFNANRTMTLTLSAATVMVTYQPGHIKTEKRGLVYKL